MRKIGILTRVLPLLVAIAFINIIVVELEIIRKLTGLQLGMVGDEVSRMAGRPNDVTIVEYSDESSGAIIKIEEKVHFDYYFPYIWDYILIDPSHRARGIRVIFADNGKVEQMETRGYMRSTWYVRKAWQKGSGKLRL